jgi:hypothetical protein
LFSVSIEDVQSSPKQDNFGRSKSGKMRFEHEGYTITPIAGFDVSARVLGSKRYHLGREADLSPVDLALGWGQMSQSEVLREIKISQRGRFYFWRTPSNQEPISRSQIIRSSSNMHMIPMDKSVARALKSIGKNDVVRIKGYLVNVNHKDGWRWRSSTSRTDTGNGACELIYVTHVATL